MRSKVIMVLFSVCILAACSGQGTSSTGSAELSTQSNAQAYKTENTSLLASLAKEYPNGQLPADRVTQAAKALSQNPSVFKVSAQRATVAPASAPIIQPQAFTATDFKPVYRIQNTTLPGSYFFTIYDSEKTAALAANPNWQLEGTAFYTLPAASTDLKPVYRFRNKLNGSYLYTAYESEKIDIQTNYGVIYELEGVAWRAQQTPAPGFTALFRFRNLTNGTYLNTSYETERDAILRDYSAIFELEGIAYYVKNEVAEPELNLACSEKLPEKTLATLPTSYSVKLLSSNVSTDKVYLTNTGYVAWQNRNSTSYGETVFYLYKNSTDNIFSKVTTGTVLGNDSIVSINDAGVVLHSPFGNQQLELSTIPFAKLWNGVTTTDSVLRSPLRINHRAGRHTFLNSIPANDGRKWLNQETISYLDGNVLVKIGDAPYAGPTPLGTNRCGINVDSWASQARNTASGLFFLNGVTKLNQVSLPFNADSVAYPRYDLVGLNDVGTSFGSLSDVPKTFPLLGFIRSISYEKYYLNSDVIDVNDANTGIGNRVAAISSPTTPTLVYPIPVEGQIMVADGVQNLKSVVPSLAGSLDILIPQAINNSGQIVVKTCTPSGGAGECVAPQKLYLLTPQ